ncbi:hypothetical protein A7R81_28575 [Pseudomonas aeruginosa]|nr:hypothetical protein AN454_06080 [Pseudomonas aeruginosa]OES68747.1 hypothetical protein A7R81_28575 [Pseudomonas aeruginosa]
MEYSPFPAVHVAYQNEMPDAATAREQPERSLVGCIQPEIVMHTIVVAIARLQGGAQLLAIQAEAQMVVAKVVEQCSVPEQATWIGA